MIHRSAAISLGLACWLSAAQAQTLRPDQVLVVYDIRVPDSVRVAEHYAGSAKVFGGIGGVAGARPGVKTLDLWTTGAPVTSLTDIQYGTFVTNLRTPIRTWLNANDPKGNIRCIVMTRGLPLRIQDTDVPSLGDDPLNGGPEFSAGDATYASVDSELTILQKDLNTGENGGTGDSFADGLIINPYHNAAAPIGSWNTRNRKVNRSFDHASLALGAGVIYKSRTVPAIQVFTPGDYYMVCRLDGPTLADTLALIDRGANNLVNLDTSVVVLDESRSNGTPDASVNTELDNDDISDQAMTVSFLRLGDDLELTRNTITSDGRLNPLNLRYDSGSAPAGFVVGPLINFGGGIVENRPILLLASEASNTAGTAPGTSGRDLPKSFNWGPMGLYNTYESFNGRAFGSLGSQLNQSQMSDAIGTGASFGIGNVNEPFAATVADNDVLVKRFFLGRMTFAEAAYMSLPALSWQQIVLGDPLARVQRSTEDINIDGRVDVNDLYVWEVLLAAGTGINVNRQGAVDDVDRQHVDQSPRPIDHLDMAGTQRP